MEKKNLNDSFRRALPTVTGIVEKPMATWATGRVKRLYDSYENFCDEIGQLLGEPNSRPHVEYISSSEIIDEFDIFWDANRPEDKHQQLLTLLSGFYKAGFVTNSTETTSVIESYFLEGDQFPPKPLLEKDFSRVAPLLKGTDDDLKPVVMDAESLKNQMGLTDFKLKPGAIAVHFWLNPDTQTSLFVFSQWPEPHRHEILLKTVALIQRRFYD